MSYTLVQTADGSYTARSMAPSIDSRESETMHSLRGAFGETVYIYGEAYSLALELAPNPRVLSLGLGLGFVELVSAAQSLKKSSKLCGESFEFDELLTENFRAWLNGKYDEMKFPELRTAYDDALTRSAAWADTSTDKVKMCLANAIQCGDWTLSGPLTSDTRFSERFDCVAFDAFSSKSTPDLWTRDFLDFFLKDACAENCVLSTYACTGHLKRALVDAGFALQIREGFASKRDSTLAIRKA